MSVLKDSGYRQEFPSGAVRDTAEGKGRMDLIDIDCAAHLLKDDPIMFRISEFVQLKDLDALYDAMQLFAERNHTEDDIVIYTGYYRNEIEQYISDLTKFKNIIVKFGRFVPDSPKIFDSVLGIELSSDNQYAEKIS